VFTLNNDDPRLRWIDQHCIHVGTFVSILHAYYCFPAPQAGTRA
jgi:hypothetical protein